MAYLPKIIDFSHCLIKRRLKPGDIAVDATAGNGYDSLLLAKLVGKEGKVFAFDIQEQALQNTETRLKRAGLQECVKLINDGHENVRKYVKQPVAAAMFNLGYLPGGDHKIVTKAETTISALQQLGEILELKGIITIVCYTGHSEGALETKELLCYLEKLEQKEWEALRYDYLNQKNNPPLMIAIERLSKD